MIATTSLPQLPEKTCTGCGGCTNACPKDAIFFAPDAEGFQHPVVQAAQCIGCKKCEQIGSALGEQQHRETGFVCCSGSGRHSSK